MERGEKLAQLLYKIDTDFHFGEKKEPFKGLIVKTKLYPEGGLFEGVPLQKRHDLERGEEGNCTSIHYVDVRGLPANWKRTERTIFPHLGFKKRILPLRRDAGCEEARRSYFPY